MKSDKTLTTENVVGVAQPRLVMRSYSRECDGDRERMLEMALRDLWRNYPEWPSTFGPCHNPDCDGSGRGSGYCAKCVTEGIADIVGMDGPAESMRRAVEDARRTANKLREMVSPHNVEWWHRRDQAPIQLETLSPVATHGLFCSLNLLEVMVA